MCLSGHSTGGAWGAPVTYRCEWQDRRWRLDAQISRWELGHEGINTGICLATAIHAPALRFLPCIMAILQIAWLILPHHAMSPMCWGPAFGGPLRRASSLVSDRLDDGHRTAHHPDGACAEAGAAGGHACGWRFDWGVSRAGSKLADSFCREESHLLQRSIAAGYGSSE